MKASAPVVALIVKKGELTLDTSDEIVRDVLVARGGDVVHPRVLEALAPRLVARS